MGGNFIQKGAKITTVEKPIASLNKIDIYIIVDPDTTTESSHQIILCLMT